MRRLLVWWAFCGVTLGCSIPAKQPEPHPRSNAVVLLLQDAKFDGHSLTGRLLVGSSGHPTQRQMRSVPSRDPGAYGQQLVNRFRNGHEYRECADEPCINEALQACSPAHLAEAYYTIEGTPAFTDFFVVKHGQTCRVVVFADFTGDYWGSCKLYRTECPTIEAAKSDDPPGNGCSETQMLYKAPVCTQPEM